MKIKVVEFLNSKGYHVVEIYERIFVANIFTPADNTNNQHFLKGRDITDLCNTDSFNLHINSDRGQQEGVLTSIENVKIVSKQFHKDYKFVYHLAY